MYIICDTWNKGINQFKDFEANLNELKRLPPNEHGHMLPSYKDKINIKCI